MQDILTCYQCRDCASRCPLAFWFDVPPPRVLRYLQDGNTEAAFHCRTTWLCAGCEKCTTECPHRLDLAKVMDRVAAAALQQGIVPPLSPAFGNKVYLADVDTRRRATQLGLIPQQGNWLGRVVFELNWRRYQVVKQTRSLLRRRIPMIPRAAGIRPPTLGEGIVAGLFTVLALPMALGLAARLALDRVDNK